MAWTADDLVAAVRRRAQLPSASEDGAINDADILLLADEELSLRLVPLVRSVRGDYWVTAEDVPIVANQAAYRVPERAQTSGLREVTVIDSGGIAYPIPQISVEDAWRWAQPNANIVGSMRSSAFYMQGTDLIIVPTPSDDSWTIRMRYYRAMSRLVPTSQSGTVTVSGGEFLALRIPFTAPNEIPLYPVPAAWGTAGFTLDVAWPNPPFGLAGTSLYVQNVDGTNPIFYVYTIDGGIPPDMIPDVYMVASYAGETSIVDLPRECWALLVSAVASRVLDLIGDREAAQLEYALYEREAQNVTLLLTPRVEGNPIRIVDRNSLLRSQRRW